MSETSTLGLVFRALYRLGRVQIPPRVNLTDISIHGGEVHVVATSGSAVSLPIPLNIDDLYQKLHQLDLTIRVVDSGDRLAMLPADSAESNWIELLYDLSTWESGLAKNGQKGSYTALRRMGAVAIVSVAAHGSVYEFHQSLAPGVEPVGVPFEIADSVFAATGGTFGGRIDRAGSGSTRCLLAPATASEGGRRHDESCRLGIIGYAIVMSTLLAACLAFLQVAAVFTPENQSTFVEFGFFFGLVCAPLGAISGAVSGLSAHLGLRRFGNDRSVRVQSLIAAVVLALGSAPGVWLAIWMYGIFGLDIHAPSPQYLVELAAAVCVLACGGALHIRSRLDRTNEGTVPGDLE